MDDPIAFFLTVTSYGTWLPGDGRGWIEYRHGWKLPDPAREREATARMTDDACRLTLEQRALVELQIEETCEHRGWTLHAVGCRSNHLHVVVTARDTSPKKLRLDIKAWCTRRLKESDPTRAQWWTDRGSIRWVFDQHHAPRQPARRARRTARPRRRSVRGEESLGTVMQYVDEAQDRMDRGK